MAGTIKTRGLLDTIFIGVLLVIFGGIVLHAPLSVWIGTTWPAFELVGKSWKEILMGLGALLAIVILWRRKQLRILREPLLLLMAGFAALHVLLVPLFYDNPTTTLAGLLIDLRYLLFFGLVYLAARLYPGLRRPFLWVVFGGALLVGIFAVLQVFVLPRDFLIVLGYGDLTIAPYLTVDENPDYIRISSTLRGPNPLGAYIVMMLALVAALWLRGKRLVAWTYAATGFLFAISIVALWTSYSRSALVAAVVAVGLIALLTVGRKLKRWMWIGLMVVALAVGGILFAARDTSFVSNVLLHENEGTGASVSSNEGHVESLADGLNRMVRQPLGAGVGSTGSASLYGGEPLIIENQYLFIAHEVGWLGLALFLVIFVRVLQGLWQRRQDWLALGVFASGIGLALIGLLLPVWVDDTVSIIWWGLAALVIGGGYGRGTLNKTAERAT